MKYFNIDDIVRIKDKYQNYGIDNYRVIIIDDDSMFVHVISLTDNKKHAFHNTILELDIVYYRKQKLKKLSYLV